MSKIVFLRPEGVNFRIIKFDMTLKQLLSFFILLLSTMSLFSQEKVLFEVEGEPVYLDEFLYIYEKTNRNDANYSEASVNEYLDLYQKFKLKVKRARDMKLDTIEALQTELAGYRKQLANSYLSDDEVLKSLTREAYDRMQTDVSFSHVLIRVPTGANAALDDDAYRRALEALERLRGGEDFETVAREVSEDPTVRTNNGRVGYVTAMLPDGFYELETAIYTLPSRTYSRPIKTPLGYHVVIQNGKRPARGEVEVAQILIRNGSNKNARSIIYEIYDELRNGADFAEVARNRSEDKATAPRGGYLGFFGINKYDALFENTAFRLKEDGDISEPIQTKIGWHIIKRLSHKPVGSFEEMERSLEAKIKSDSRFQIAEEAMLDRIKDENDFEEMDWNRDRFLAEVGEDFLTYRWKAPESYDNQTLFTLQGEPVQVSKFLQYLSKNAALRLRLNQNTPVPKALDELYGSFLEASLKEHEESQLEEKYPEFKALMREYSEGILLFEATKMSVWDRASNDTTGLREYFKEHRDDYMWPERALVETITITDQDPAVVQKVMNQVKTKSGQQLIKKFNKKSESVRVQSEIIDREELDPDLQWMENSVAEPYKPAGRDVTMIKKVSEIIAPTRKSLEEARGYVIADYQDFLEKEWVASLKDMYEVKVNEEVLSSIIKS